MGRLVGECGKTVVADCITRWNSTYFMCKRLLEIKVAVTDALNHIGADGLLASEWSRQEELVNLLEPFAVQTNILQTDTMSLSTVIPSLLELECHLKQGSTLAAVRKVMREKFEEKFACVLDPDNELFNPLPATACLLDPTLAMIMFTSRAAILCEAAKDFIRSHQAYIIPVTATRENGQVTDSTASCPPALKKFKFLSSQLAIASGRPRTNNDDQLERYIAEVSVTSALHALDFWQERRAVYCRLFVLATDLLASPASQAYVERMFSLCGYLSAGKRNRMERNLEMRAFLKMNKNLL